MADGNSHFLMAIGRHDEGHLIESLDDELRRCISAVRTAGKTAKLKLEMSLAPNGNGFKVSFKHGSTLPTLANGEAFYFADVHDSLTRNAPARELTDIFSPSDR